MAARRSSMGSRGSSRHENLGTYRVGRSADAPELFQPRFSARTEPALEHRVVAGDRLDLLAARYFGDPLQFWRIADANPAASPDELLEPGRTLIIPRVS
jgi:nucleoid-associated protein YgaU